MNALAHYYAAAASAFHEIFYHKFPENFSRNYSGKIPFWVIWLHLRCWSYASLFFKFLWWAPKTHVFWNRVRNGRSRSSKVIDFGTNRKRVCNFLLVISVNLGPILFRFRDIAGLCREQRPHPHSTQILAVFPTGDVGVSRSEDPKFIIRVSIFDGSQLTWPR